MELHFSHTKRGLSTRDMVSDNYKDTQSDRFSLGSEERVISSIDLKVPTKYQNLFFKVNLNYVKFSNAGIEMIDGYIYQGVDSKKVSLDLGILYNFPSNFK